ncbi:MAG TPA: rRNA maturation RNase YbeY [Candidatus Paceibacterota bacterium]|nr:rRNA maturation RNase YbeY [Candidatus Paceibacterota bacterium]
MTSKSKVYFFFDKVTINLKGRAGLKKAIEGIFKREKKDLVGVNYVFCSDKALLKINRQYLQHDDYTDIITFDLSETGSGIVGEIYISIDRVRDNARKNEVLLKTELLRVIFHGALHLCGYNDKTSDEKTRMRGKENYYLSYFTDCST